MLIRYFKPPEPLWLYIAEKVGYPRPSHLDSLILSELPEIVSEFRGRRFALLWRGSRDGFGAFQFHGRCDGHSNTLTAILDTNGNVFGGFTPVVWESRKWNGFLGSWDSYFKADESLKSFLFTLKNPHNVAARKFALKGEMKHQAIYYSSECGPCFSDIRVADDCNTRVEYSGSSMFGSAYLNDTGLDGKTFFTGAPFFKVKEIEVLEVLEEGKGSVGLIGKLRKKRK